MTEGGESLERWESPEVVERFAEREPDRRLVRLVDALPHPERVRALDLGCAGGRNAVFLARRGLDVHALDASEGMVEETRHRLGAILGPAEAHRRVRRGRMDDLSSHPSESFDLVVALGVYQNARDMAEWHRALGETARVLRVGGTCLVAHFTPDVDLTGEGVVAVPGEAHVYAGLPFSERSVLLDAVELDREVAGHSLAPLEVTETVVVPRAKGRRSTANGWFVRLEDASRTGGRGTAGPSMP